MMWPTLAVRSSSTSGTLLLMGALLAGSSVRADGPRPGEAAALRDKIRGQVVRVLTEHCYPAAVDPRTAAVARSLVDHALDFDWDTEPGVSATRARSSMKRRST